jgi:hypothetical protein
MSKSKSPSKRAAASAAPDVAAPAVPTAPADDAVAEALAATDEPAIVSRLEAPSRWSGALVAGGLMLVAGASVFAIRRFARRK